MGGKRRSNGKTSRLDKVFTITRGNKLDLNKMTLSRDPEAVAFIGRSEKINGLRAFVEIEPGVEPYEAGLITVALGGSALASFVQPRRFYTAQNIDVLDPKTPMSLDQKLYYCLCIEANRFRYSTFGREANRTLASLAVPALESVPSWVEGTVVLAGKRLAGEIYRLANDSDGSAH